MAPQIADARPEQYRLERDVGAHLATPPDPLVKWMFGFDANDPMTVGGAALLTTAVVAAASLQPAHRVPWSDTMVALRCE